MTSDDSISNSKWIIEALNDVSWYVDYEKGLIISIAWIDSVRVENLIHLFKVRIPNCTYQIIGDQYYDTRVSIDIFLKHKAGSELFRVLDKYKESV